MARKNNRKRLNKTKELYMFGRLVQKSKAAIYCKLHKCYLEPKDITDEKCKIKLMK
ncbi:MAG: hypothetical protein J6D03_02090 [Clostridia bacterium]|nr:hypothetical protein [Clostridia bacterium]